jgi:hypothetical protein
MILLEPYFTPAASIDPAYRYDNRLLDVVPR